MYFAYLGHYTAAICIPAVFGLIIYICTSYIRDQVSQIPFHLFISIPVMISRTRVQPPVRSLIFLFLIIENSIEFMEYNSWKFCYEIRLRKSFSLTRKSARVGEKKWQLLEKKENLTFSSSSLTFQTLTKCLPLSFQEFRGYIIFVISRIWQYIFRYNYRNLTICFWLSLQEFDDMFLVVITGIWQYIFRYNYRNLTIWFLVVITGIWRYVFGCHYRNLTIWLLLYSPW